MILLFVACLFTAGVSHAQGAGVSLSTPAHKSALRDWRWWVGEGVIVGATVLDAQSTCRNFRRGYAEGVGPLAGQKDCVKTSLFAVGANATYTAMHLWVHRTAKDADVRGEKPMSYMLIPGIVFAIHGSAAIHNYRLPDPRTCPQIPGCSQ